MFLYEIYRISMETKNKLKGKGLITFLLVVFRIFFLLASIALIIMGIYGLISLFREVPYPITTFPVLFSFTNEGILSGIGDLGGSKISMVYGTGFIIADELPRGFVLLYTWMMLLQYAIYLLSIKLIIQILETAKDGAFLITKNAIRLRWIAVLGIFFYVVSVSATLISTSYLSDKLEFENLEFTNKGLFAYVASKSAVFYYLFLLVIAEAFRVGAQLKKENDLTI